MTSMRGDIVNRVKRFPKPSTSAEALQPIFEAVSNAFHAVEDAFGDHYQEHGVIVVQITSPRTPADIQIIVTDNGVGLDSRRFAAFCTTDTDFKLPRGGKGVGRLLWLDAFEEIKIISIYRDGGQTRRRSFVFALRSDDQIIEETDVAIPNAPTGTTITFRGLRGAAYRAKVPSQASAIIRHFGSHFFADFILGKSPRVTLDIDGVATEFPREIENLRIEDRGIATIQTADFGELKLASFICHKSASANFEGLHQIHLVANGRTVVTRKLDGLVGVGRFGPNDDHVYHGCVTGDFLNDRVNQERTQFNFDESIIEDIVRVCAEHARANALAAEVAEFDNVRLGTMREFVTEYPTFGFEEAQKLLARAPKNATKAEQFAQALVPIRIRRDKERNDRIQNIVHQLSNIGEVPEDFAAAVKSAADDIRAEEQRQLTEYVLRRKTVLDVMEVLIRKIRERGNGSQDFQLEETLHQFLCPMKLRGTDPARIESSDHDLWIIDERLTFTRYFASDVPLTQLLEGQGSTLRPDLLIYDQLHGLGAEGENPLTRVMLVEFKQPGRRDYDERYTPQSQIMEYVNKLRDGDIFDYRGGRVRVANDCVFYCYVVADIVGKLKIHTSGWRTTANGRGRIQELSGELRGMIEVIEWADLINDARLRNHAFVHAAGLRYESHP